MTVSSATRAGRRLAESLMVDECVVRRRTGTTTDPVTGVETPVFTDVHAGRAKSQSYEPNEQNPDGAGHEFTQQRYSVHFPVGSFVPEVGDVIEWTVCRLDPDLVGRKDRITALFNKSLATAMRVAVDRDVA